MRVWGFFGRREVRFWKRRKEVVGLEFVSEGGVRGGFG